jgi:hypothetical protein
MACHFLLPTNFVGGASSLPKLKLDSSISKSQITAFLGFEFHYRLDIIFDLEMVLTD